MPDSNQAAPQETKNAQRNEETSTGDERLLRRIKNNPIVAFLIVGAVILLAILTFANDISEQWEKLLSHRNPASQNASKTPDRTQPNAPQSSPASGNNPTPKRSDALHFRARTTEKPSIKIRGPVNQSSTGACSPNIIGSDNVTNCSSEPEITASSQSQIHTEQPDAPWVVRFSITSSALVQTGDLRLKCSGAVIRAGIGRINPGNLVTGSNGPLQSDPTTVVYELGSEVLSPGQAVPIEVYSKEPVTVLSGSIGGKDIHFNEK
jgi:hypothetical protein